MRFPQFACSRPASALRGSVFCGAVAAFAAGHFLVASGHVGKFQQKGLDATATKKPPTDEPNEAKQQAARVGAGAEVIEKDRAGEGDADRRRGDDNDGKTPSECLAFNGSPTDDANGSSPATGLEARARWNTLIGAAHEALAGRMAAARRRAFEIDADAYSFMVFRYCEYLAPGTRRTALQHRRDLIILVNKLRGDPELKGANDSAAEPAAAWNDAKEPYKDAGQANHPADSGRHFWATR
ncbi:MAG: hypothetical protein BJ554DRAFT_1412 [Olpidium bornovanus]|uniref:Uncharacterized protein n=1 Tax=Olpidium bornovanus TaxID=278681 RepID=A0A8H7ZS32_9FUNG|nr:MAG: hypothetical protein BJ554DRAFT_1412 [Olpidium bornovanus]